MWDVIGGLSTLPPSELAEFLDDLNPGQSSLADVLNLDPAVLEQLVDRALALAGAGKYDEAEALLTQLCKVDHKSAMLSFILASVLAERSHNEAALEAAQDALRRDQLYREGPTEAFQAEVHTLVASMQCKLQIQS